MEVAPKGVGVLGAEVGLDAALGEVHDGEAAGGGVRLFRLLPSHPHPAGSMNETKPAHPSQRFVLAVTEYVRCKPDPAAAGVEAEVGGGVVVCGGAGAGHQTGQGNLKA